MLPPSPMGRFASRAASIRSAARRSILFGALAAALWLWFMVPRWLDQRTAAAVAVAASRQPEREALARRVVVLDAGHGGVDGGTTANRIEEKTATLDLTRRVEKELRRLGIEVRLTRGRDGYVELAERCAVARREGAAVMVSLHLNASSAKNVAGIETYFSSRRGAAEGSMARVRLGSVDADDGAAADHRSELLAAAIQRRVCGATGAADRGVRDSHLFVVMHAPCPAVLIECGYLTNAEEARRLGGGRYKDKMAAAIADGIRHYLVATGFNPRRGLASAPAGHDVAAAGR